MRFFYALLCFFVFIYDCICFFHPQGVVSPCPCLTVWISPQDIPSTPAAVLNTGGQGSPDILGQRLQGILATPPRITPYSTPLVPTNMEEDQTFPTHNTPLQELTQVGQRSKKESINTFSYQFCYFTVKICWLIGQFIWQWVSVDWLVNLFDSEFLLIDWLKFFTVNFCFMIGWYILQWHLVLSLGIPAQWQRNISGCPCSRPSKTKWKGGFEKCLNKHRYQHADTLNSNVVSLCKSF